MKKLLAALLLTLPSMAVAIDLEGYYITAKGGVIQNIGYRDDELNNLDGDLRTLQNEDLGTGSAFGFSVGKYLTDSFRLELEAIKRTGYEYDANLSLPEVLPSLKQRFKQRLYLLMAFMTSNLLL
jgi:hypothetical protein